MLASTKLLIHKYSLFLEKALVALYKAWIYSIQKQKDLPGLSRLECV